MKKLLLALTAAAFATPVFAGQINIVDGDTVKIGKKTIRIVEIDTPESYQPRCEQELVKALEAKERLRQLLDTGKVSYKATGKDRFGRTLAHVFVGGTNVGKTLIAEGHALSYKPGAAAKMQRLQAWCGPTAKLDDVWAGKVIDTCPNPDLLSCPKNDPVANEAIRQVAQTYSNKRQNQQGEFSGPFPNCAAARAAGRAPLYANDRGYQPKLDRDRDGVACE